MTVSRLFWERQDGETSRSFEAFTTYRDLGPTRSLRQAAGIYYGAESTPKPHRIRQFKEWSRQNMWVARAEAYDAEQERRRQLERQEHIKEALERGRKAALLLQRIALDGLTLYQNQGRGDPPLALLKYLQAGLAEERLALGIPNDVTQLELRGTPGAAGTDHERSSRLDAYRRSYNLAKEALQ